MSDAKKPANPVRNERIKKNLNTLVQKTQETSAKLEEKNNSELVWCKEPGKPSEKWERYNSEHVWCKGPVKPSEKWERYNSERVWCKEPRQTLWDIRKL